MNATLAAARTRDTTHRWRSGSAIAVAACALLLAGCGDKGKDKPATQTAAKVNKEEITVHQINALLEQQRGLKPEQAEAARKQVLERLIDQELAVQKAAELKVDRDARVVQQIESAKREIIARAYFDRIGEGASKPTTEEVRKYFDDNPALFSERRLYQLQELSIEAKPDVAADLKGRLQGAKDINEFVAYLKANNIRFGVNQAVRPAEQLPLASLTAFAKLKDGQAVFSPTATGAQVVVLAGSRSEPVDLERAKPAIEQFLLNERKRKIVADDLKALRGAGRIEYVGAFAASAASAAVPASAAAVAAPAPAPVVSAPVAPAPSPAPASGALDAATINKGLGLK